jgi:hypothetical protein
MHYSPLDSSTAIAFLSCRPFLHCHKTSNGYFSDTLLGARFRRLIGSILVDQKAARHLLDLGALVQETIGAQDLFSYHEEVTESAVTLLTNCELDIVDIRKRVGEARRIISVIVGMNPKHLCSSGHLRDGRIEERRKREG